MVAVSDLPPGVRVFERGWLSANGILFEGVENTALVDTGYATHSTQTVALVRSALGDRPLDLIVNTHLHSDHCGGNAALQAEYAGARTLIPPGLARFVSNWDPFALSYAPTGQVCPPFRFGGLLETGREVMLGGSVWQVHAAPGHDPHSIVLFEPRSRTLISADALWENGFGIVFEELEGSGAFDEVARTLDLIEALAPRVVVPGHGPIFTDVSLALGRARSKLDVFVGDPQKHARHASKVLLKFKLLELQRVPEAALKEWALQTLYFEMVRQRFFADSVAGHWIEELIASLVRSGAARREGSDLLNA